MFGKKKITVEPKVLESAIEKAVRKIVEDAMNDAQSILRDVKTVADLRKQINNLEIDKGKIEEKNERKERELEHKIGLEKKRQEQELEIGKREAVVTVKEENLTADKERFDEQLGFHEERFTEEVGYLKDIVGKVLTCVQNMGGSDNGNKDGNSEHVK
ncbi:hypothetical protein LCGC14_2978260 [marine sediment metagenome]|uniref:Uncharacterized protein n=1 Tax=marine sediment metagenome TaxID=412755 RepID=A0A0F8X888_9ZZZZ